jgi:hypothetical protein
MSLDPDHCPGGCFNPPWATRQEESRTYAARRADLRLRLGRQGFHRHSLIQRTDTAICLLAPLWRLSIWPFLPRL